jgi:hypothetical protein
VGKLGLYVKTDATELLGGVNDGPAFVDALNGKLTALFRQFLHYGVALSAYGE